MAVEQPKQLESSPKSTSEKKVVEFSLGGFAEIAKKDFNTPSEKNILAKNLEKELVSNWKDFSPDFRKKYSNDKGEMDMKKMMGLFPGLDQHLGDQLDQEGKVLPPAIKEEKKTAESNGKIPERPATALTGSQFISEMQKLGNMNKKENQYKMETQILAEIEKGNIPSFCRPENMKILTKEIDGIKVQYRAGLDYLAIGSDNNFVRVPMTPLLAQALAKKYGWGLPTAAMTDHIYASADIKLQGIGLVGKDEDQMYMQGNEFIDRHNQKINSQLGIDGLARLQQGKALVAGHKKDVIISQYALTHPGQLDFRGLYINGRPIQTNPAHEDSYRDYSHGFRPIDGNVVIAYANGQTKTMPYYEALQDPQIAKVLNGAEGVIKADNAYKNSKKFA